MLLLPIRKIGTRLRYKTLFDKTGLFFISLLSIFSILVLSRNGRGVLNYVSYRGITTYYMTCLYVQISSIHNAWTSDPRSHQCDEVTLSSAKNPLEEASISPSTLHCKQSPCQIAYMTFSTTCSSNLNNLVSSSMNSNIDFGLLGLDSTWSGWGGRMRAYARYIRSLPASTIVIASDASDVLLLPSCRAEDIVKDFRNMDTPILFTAEKACFPDRELESLYPPSLSPYKYLNAGAFIGYAWALRLLFEAAYTCDCSDDQRAYTDIFLKECSYTLGIDAEKGLICREKLRDFHRTPTAYGRIFAEFPKFNESDGRGGKGFATEGTRFPLLKLDYENRIFQSLYDTSIDNFEFELLDDHRSDDQSRYRLKNRMTEGKPCIFHQNGPKSDETVLLEISKRLEL